MWSELCMAVAVPDNIKLPRYLSPNDFHSPTKRHFPRLQCSIGTDVVWTQANEWVWGTCQTRHSHEHTSDDVEWCGRVAVYIFCQQLNRCSIELNYRQTDLRNAFLFAYRHKAYICLHWLSEYSYKWSCSCSYCCSVSCVNVCFSHKHAIDDDIKMYMIIPSDASGAFSAGAPVNSVRSSLSQPRRRSKMENNMQILLAQ